MLDAKPGSLGGGDTTAYSRNCSDRFRKCRASRRQHCQTGCRLGLQIKRSVYRIVKIRSTYASRPLRSPSPAAFFKPWGVSLVAGRDFAPTDTPKSRAVVILSRSAAERLFPNQPAAGHSIVINDRERRQTLTVIGVAADARLGDLRRSQQVLVYLPLFQDAKSTPVVMEIRGVAGLSGLSSLMRTVASRIQAMNREYVFWSESVQSAIDVNLAEERMVTTLLTFFALCALFLALIGIYGVFAFTVSRRTREFGLRMALGAGRVEVFPSILQEAVAWIGIGIVVGLPLAIAGRKLLASSMSGLDHADVASLVFASVLLLAISSAVAAFPAIRAARTDISEALRFE